MELSETDRKIKKNIEFKVANSRVQISLGNTARFNEFFSSYCFNNCGRYTGVTDDSLKCVNGNGIPRLLYGILTSNNCPYKSH